MLIVGDNHIGCEGHLFLNFPIRIFGALFNDFDLGFVQVKQAVNDRVEFGFQADDLDRQGSMFFPLIFQEGQECLNQSLVRIQLFALCQLVESTTTH